jgi:hypothetical protein
MSQARKSHTATLLQNGKVLMAGGKTPSRDTDKAELYDPASRTFSSTGSMVGVRSLHAASLLNNGFVLISGGRKGSTPLATCELYNPSSGTFSNTGLLNVQRKRHQSTLLTNGTVLVEGGASLNNGDPVNPGTPTAEIFNPSQGAWTLTQEMHIGRTEHDATLLPDGTVLVTGGVSFDSESDLYNPATHAFSSNVPGVLQPRQRHVAILLTNPAWGSLVGQVLIIGGASTGNSVFGGIQKALDSVEIYDPVAKTMSLFGTMTEPRQNHTATLLNDGRILIAGGVDSPAISGTAELVQP